MNLAEILAQLEAGETLTLDELAFARDALRDEIRTGAETGAELADLLALRESRTAVVSALTELETAAAEHAAQVAEIVAEVDDTGDGDNDGDGEAEATEAEVEAEADEAAAPIAASARAALSRIRDRAPAPTVEAPPADEATVTMSLAGKELSTPATAREIAQAFHKTGRVMREGKTTVAAFNVTMPDGQTLTSDGSTNSQRLMDLAVNASCCALPEPVRDTVQLGGNCTPIRDAFPVMTASRGAVVGHGEVCIPDAGADIWTCDDQDAVDPDDPETWKQCYVVDCEDQEPTVVEPIYRCAEIDSFSQRFTPEQWEAHLFALSKLGTRAAEADLFARLWALGTTTHDGDATGSVYANAVNSLGRAADLIRQDQRYCDVELVAVGPEWLYGAVQSDLTVRGLNVGVDFGDAKAKLDTALGNAGIEYVGSLDVDDLEGTQIDGPIAPYLASASIIIVPRRSVRVLDGGERNLGIEITDHALNRQNKVAAFWETYQGLFGGPCNAKRINLPVEICGSAPCGDETEGV